MARWSAPVAFDSAVVGATRHVVWQRLTVDEQADLTANYPRHPSITPPADDVCGDDVDPRFEQWLDGAYLARHSTDAITDDPGAF